MTIDSVMKTVYGKKGGNILPTVPNCLDEIVTVSYIMGHEITLQCCNILVAEFNNKIINFEKSHLSHKF